MVDRRNRDFCELIAAMDLKATGNFSGDLANLSGTITMDYSMMRFSLGGRWAPTITTRLDGGLRTVMDMNDGVDILQLTFSPYELFEHARVV